MALEVSSSAWQVRSAEALRAAMVDEFTAARECVDAGGTRLSSTPWRAQAGWRKEHDLIRVRSKSRGSFVLHFLSKF
jgi:hypothetical protein